MKKWLKTLLLSGFGVVLLFPDVVLCQDMSNKEIVRELKAVEKKHHHSVKGLDARRRNIEDKIKRWRFPGEWTDRIQLSGLLEVEAFYGDTDYNDPTVNDEDSSDIALATMALGVDADISKQVKGHVTFLWEEDDAEPIDLEEGIIVIDGDDDDPLCLKVGKTYVPFGYFESHFISDPLTLTLGETRESALLVGFEKDLLEVYLGFFNGDIDETGDDDHVDSFVASAIVTSPEESESGVSLTAGLSYISNIADSDSLQDANSATIQEHVDGLSAFVCLSSDHKFFLEAEYLGAMDRFQAGELSFDGGQGYKPRA